jgi:hypothetical protein
MKINLRELKDAISIISRARSIDPTTQDDYVQIYSTDTHFYITSRTSSQIVISRAQSDTDLDHHTIALSDIRDVTNTITGNEIDITIKGKKLHVNESGNAGAQVPLQPSDKKMILWKDIDPEGTLPHSIPNKLAQWIRTPTYAALHIKRISNIMTIWLVDNGAFGVIETNDPGEDMDVTIGTHLLSAWKDDNIDIAVEKKLDRSDRLWLTGKNTQIATPYKYTTIPDVSPLLSTDFDTIQVNSRELKSALSTLLPLTDPYTNIMSLIVRPKVLDIMASNKRRDTKGTKSIAYKGGNTLKCDINGKVLLNTLSIIPDNEEHIMDIAQSSNGLFRVNAFSDNMTVSLFMMVIS